MSSYQSVTGTYVFTTIAALEISPYWNLQLGVVPLPKANHAQHQRENLNVFDFEISQSDMVKLRTLNEHYSGMGPLPYV